MKNYLQYILSGSLLGLFSITCNAQTPVNPIIKGYGTINSLGNVVLPDKNLEYKIVVDLKSANDNFDKVNKGLNNLARAMNLHGAGGVPKENIHLVAVLHYTATPLVLNNVGYQKKYGVNNPNLELIKELKEAGVDIYICGQSLVARKYAFEDVNPDVSIGLSMLTVVSEHMMKGYSLLVFQ